VTATYVSAVLASGSAISLTTITPANIAAVTLPAGDWDVAGVVDYSLSSASTTDFTSGTSATSATFVGQDTSINLPLVLTTTTDLLGHTAPVTRYSLSLTTTIYLIAEAAFSAGSVSAYGTLRARRMG
jgi:hypothetical protein